MKVGGSELSRGCAVEVDASDEVCCLCGCMMCGAVCCAVRVLLLEPCQHVRVRGVTCVVDCVRGERSAVWRAVLLPSFDFPCRPSR